MYEFIKMTSTNWSIIKYYKIPEKLRFEVTNKYSHWKLDDNSNHLITEYEELSQIATYVSITIRKSDKTLFDVQILDENFCNIRGKVAKENNCGKKYNNIIETAKGLY